MKSPRRAVAICSCLPLLAAIWLLLPNQSLAHCDTMDGPVVQAAKVALEKGDITPVLKWVKPEQEGELRAAFSKTQSVRTQSPAAKELADMYFFETLVRLHRAGEGAPYEGLKPAGQQEPIIVETDKALERGSEENLVQEMTNALREGVGQRFAEAMEAKRHSEESVEAGRKFVEAYVEYVHYVERLHLDALGTAAHHGETEETQPKGHHEH